MKNNVLVVNQKEEVLYEFKKTFQGTEYEISIAKDGYEALILLKKQAFAVVVTSLVLDGYNGEHIVDYVERKAPLTRCIVYAPVITPVQLKYLYNEHQIFRLYIMTVDLKTVMKDAIEDAVLEYETAIVQQDEEAEHQDWIEKQEKANQEIRDRMKFEKEGFQGMEKFAEYLLELGRSYLYGKENPQKQQQIILFQKKMLLKFHAVNELVINDILSLTRYMEQEKKMMDYGEEVRIQRDENIENDVEHKTLKKAYMITWILLLMYKNEEAEYAIRIHYGSSGKNRMRIMFQAENLDEKMCGEERKEQIFFGQKMVEAMSVSCANLSGQGTEQVKYQILVN